MWRPNRIELAYTSSTVSLEMEKKGERALSCWRKWKESVFLASSSAILLSGMLLYPGTHTRFRALLVICGNSHCFRLFLGYIPGLLVLAEYPRIYTKSIVTELIEKS